MASYLLVLAGVVVGGCALLLHTRKSPLGRGVITPRTALVAIGCTAVVGLVVVLCPTILSNLGPLIDVAGDQGESTPDGKPAADDVPPRPLAVGEVAPPLSAQGWINGPPRAGETRLTVVDIWALW
jgi:hypothetical protein